MAVLVVGDDGGCLRHYLQGRPVQAGSMLELQVESGWQGVRYEAEWADNSIIPHLFLPDGQQVMLSRL